jgi:P pilus assembly chaperone PapD
MLRNGLLRASLGLLLGVCITSQALAGVSVGRTRVIFEGDKRETSVPIRNIGTSPYLVQSWVELGDPSAEGKPPLLVTPPISRLNGGKENILRIVRTRNDLPTDRESLFWLNVKEIPPAAKGENLLQIALRSRIKLFYRPAGLSADNTAALQAPESLKWSVAPPADGKPAALKVDNPSPFYITFESIKLEGTEGKGLDADMVEPFGSASYPLEALAAAPGSKVEFTTINDYGGYSQPITAVIN